MNRIIRILILCAGLFVSSAAVAGFDDAMSAYRLGDFKTAFNGFVESAKAGNHIAQHNVAVMYYRGEGVAKDPTRAYAWMLLAVQGDDPDILRAHHVLMILTDQASLEGGQRLASSLARENGLKLEEYGSVAGLRVVSGR